MGKLSYSINLTDTVNPNHLPFIIKFDEEVSDDINKEINQFVFDFNKLQNIAIKVAKNFDQKHSDPDALKTYDQQAYREFINEYLPFQFNDYVNDEKLDGYFYEYNDHGENEVVIHPQLAKELALYFNENLPIFGEHDQEDERFKVLHTALEDATYVQIHDFVDYLDQNYPLEIERLEKVASIRKTRPHR